MIDFEYGGPNYLAYDIANHFCEFAGGCNLNLNLIIVLTPSINTSGFITILFHFHSPSIGIDNVDYGRYPDEAMQKKWLRMYLQEAAKLRGRKIILTQARTFGSINI